MGILRIALFGGLRVRHESAQANEKLPPGAQRLFGFLLVKRSQAHTREELTDLFWPDCREDRGRACLNTELWRLRRILEPQGTPRGTYLKSVSANSVQFNPTSDHWLDVADFETRVRTIVSRATGNVDATELDGLRTALELYSGGLLEGIYDDWVLFERERMRCLYIDGLAFLMAHGRDHRNHLEAIRCGRKILDLDPLREEIHRELMRLYVDCGQRPQALVQYQTCREILNRELGISPMEETQAVYAEIVGQARPVPQRRPDPHRNATLKQAMQHMRTAAAGLEEGRTALRQAVSLVQNLAKQAPTTDE